MIFGNLKLSDKILKLIFLVFILWSWILYETKFRFDDNLTIKAKISKQIFNLKTIDDRRSTKRTETLLFSQLYFPNSNILKNSLYGNLGYRSNFFIDFTSNFYLDKDSEIRFEIYSDDGFRLKIDGKKVAEFIKDRPYQKSEGKIFLKKGKHHFTLNYFQGYGNLGLGVWYIIDNKKTIFGKDSKILHFEKIEK